ncbi:MAG: hypothetical protein A3H35_11400 [Betaproteobacteria bacterium RIFCSPLOWO2_02_FULL_62_17]|nr:MAG: hypothetical protein A3H35_11400 [Betaproteobacteria bacterium RIFCSPLOWO2_02_FULL_62_17]
MTAALLRAFVSLLHPKMLLLMIWPMVVALLLWIGLAVAFWSEAAQWIDVQFQSTDTVQWMFTFWPLALVATHLAWIVLAIALVPLILVTAVLIIGIFAMPAMVTHVSASDYPALARGEGGTFAGSIWNAAAGILVFLLLAVVTLPLWLVPLFWPLLPVLLFAYLNQRVFRYDALAEHASAEEMEQIIRGNRSELFALGVVIAIAGHIPILGFFIPVYAGLAFIHFCLEKLQTLRGAAIEGTEGTSRVV